MHTEPESFSFHIKIMFKVRIIDVSVKINVEFEKFVTNALNHFTSLLTDSHEKREKYNSNIRFRFKKKSTALCNKRGKK